MIPGYVYLNKRKDYSLVYTHPYVSTAVFVLFKLINVSAAETIAVSLLNDGFYRQESYIPIVFAIDLPPALDHIRPNFQHWKKWRDDKASSNHGNANPSASTSRLRRPPSLSRHMLGVHTHPPTPLTGTACRKAQMKYGDTWNPWARPNVSLTVHKNFALHSCMDTATSSSIFGLRTWWWKEFNTKVQLTYSSLETTHLASKVNNLQISMFCIA